MSAAVVVFALPRGRTAQISRAGPKYARAIRRWYGASGASMSWQNAMKPR